MATVLEFISNITREASESLTRSVQAMPADKQTWQPLDAGRSALDQVQECGPINYYMAQILSTRSVPAFDPDLHARFKAENDTVEKALAALAAGTDTLVAAIKAFPEQHLDETVTLPFGGGMTRSFSWVALVGYWNMTYHLGQINYIQTLYGDKQMH